MAFTTAEIGPKYDIGVATRDGSTLAVLNKDGKTVQVSSCAFMLSPSQDAVEETELDHKALLTRLSSNNVMDREFDSWVQATQGDWAGGALQRVFTDTTRYWDGLGLIWPLTDFLPQQPFLPAATARPAGITTLATITAQGFGAQGGYVKNIGNGYAVVGSDASGPRVAFFGPGGVGGTWLTPSGGFGAGFTVLDFCVALGSIWVLASGNSAPNALYLERVDWSGAGTLSVTNVQTLFNNANSFGLTHALAVGQIGGRIYAAVAASYAPNAGPAFRSDLYIVDLTVASTPSMTSVSLPGTNNVVVNQIVFVGDAVVVLSTDQQTTTFSTYSVAASTFSTLAQVPGATAWATAVGGTLFVLAGNSGNGIPQGGQVDMYLLQGTNLQHIGELNTIGYLAQWVDSFSRPATFGPYAVFALGYTGVGVTGNCLAVLAYDVLRGRLFPAWLTTGQTSAMSNTNPGWPLGVYATSNPQTPASFYSPFGIALPLAVSSNNVSAAQEMYFGVTSTKNGSLLRQAVKVRSSLIDYTSGQTDKMYQSVIVTHDPVIAGTSVTITAYFDQDPATFTLNPLTITHSYSAQDLDPTHTVLFLNKLARKYFYEVSTTNSSGYSSGFIAAPTIYSVATRLATGWVWTTTLECTDLALDNTKTPQAYCFDQQGLDAVAAYNFLRALWRQKSGQFTATLPNGDSYSAQIVDGHFASKKPLANSERSDTQTAYQTLVTFKFREAA